MCLITNAFLFIFLSTDKSNLLSVLPSLVLSNGQMDLNKATSWNETRTRLCRVEFEPTKLLAQSLLNINN